MDFTKLVSLLDSQRLFFARADTFDDPFEGSWPLVNWVLQQQVPPDITEDEREAYAKLNETLRPLYKAVPRFTAVNCWHMNNYESAAMWKLYLKSDEGIAVQSTYSQLRDSIIDDETVYLGTVSYIDYTSEWIVNAQNLMSPFVHKRKSFEHEQEVRALVSKMPGSNANGMDITQETIPGGLKIRVDIEKLIEKIYIAPSAPNWLAELTHAVVHKYGFNFEIVQSNLAAKPIF